jgi:oligoribonuclease (3'-5' exoribonuclease)
MEFTDLIWNIVLGSIVGLIIGKWLVDRIERRVAKSELETVSEELETGKLIPLTVEKINDDFLCYNSLTNDFVCQGRNIIEIVEHFHARFPNSQASLHRGEDSVLSQLKQQLKQHQTNKTATQ